MLAFPDPSDGSLVTDYWSRIPGRGVAQPGSAFAWGAKGHEFKSRRPDHFSFRGISAQIFQGSENSTRRRGEAFPRLVTRNGDDLPATRETRAAAFAAAVSDSDDGTTKKPDGRIFPLAFNDLLTGEADRIFGDASGVVRSACPAKS